MGIRRVLVPWSCCRLIEIIYVKSLEVYCKCLRNETLAVININILGLMTVVIALEVFFNQGLTYSHPFVLQCMRVCCAQLLQSCPTLCDPTDCSPPGSSVHGISQARILESVAMPSSRGSSWPRDQTCVSCIAGLYHSATWEALIKPSSFL